MDGIRLLLLSKPEVDIEKLTQALARMVEDMSDATHNKT
jgi:hypothetical protein